MANNILSTVELIAKANDILTKHSANLDQATASLNSYINSAKLPSDFVNGVKSIDKAQKDIIKTTKELEKTEKQMQRQRISDLKLQEKRERAFDKYDRQLQREQRILTRTQGLYNRIQRGVNSVSRAYNDLAVKKALNGKLTQQEELQLTKLEAKLNKYQGVLKKVDSNIGKYQRNVGNYASGWNGLSNSINQLTREAPAFANSVQTGFMALSNNIPILTDEIGRLITANKALQAEGKPTVSVFKQIMKSLFSLQTLMAVGITLLVLYGKEIGEWASSVMGAGKAADRMAENTKKINEESAKLSSQTIPQFKALIEIAQDVTESEERRADAIRELNEQYPDFNANILQEGNNTDVVNGAIAEYINKLGQKAKAQASMNLMQEKYSELIIKEQENEQKRQAVLEQINANRKLNNKELFKTQEEAISYLDQLNKKFEEQNKTIPKSQQASNSYKWSIDSLNDSNKELSEIQEEINALMNIYIDNADLSTKNNDKGNLVRKNSIKYFQNIISKLEDEQSRLAVNSKEWQIYENRINETKITLESFLASLEKLESVKTVESFAEAWDNIQKILTTPIVVEGIDYDKINSELDDWSKEYEAQQKKIADIHKYYASQRRSIEHDLSESLKDLAYSVGEAIFQSQLNALERESNINRTRAERSLQFVESGSAAEVEIKRQAAEKEAEIEKKRIETEKKAFLFQQAFKLGEVAIDTIQKVAALKAQAAVLLANPITAALAPLALGQIPLVIGAGAIAAGAIVAQSLPAFWQGGVHSGGDLIMNDDPYGKKGSNFKEVAETPSGKLHTPTGKNVKMNLPKGTVIHPTYDAFINSLDTELISNNIMPVGAGSIMPMVINNGLNKGDILEVMNTHANKLVNTIERQHGIKVNIDENGIHKYITKKGHTSKVMNARWSGRGNKV